MKFENKILLHSDFILNVNYMRFFINVLHVMLSFFEKAEHLFFKVSLQHLTNNIVLFLNMNLSNKSFRKSTLVN